jgi:hypothetical protein
MQPKAFFIGGKWRAVTMKNYSLLKQLNSIYLLGHDFYQVKPILRL